MDSLKGLQVLERVNGGENVTHFHAHLRVRPIVPGVAIIASVVVLSCLAMIFAPGCDSGIIISGNNNLNTNTPVTPGVLKVQVLTDSLAAAGQAAPSAATAPDDIDVNLTPTAYSIAFKRIVIQDSSDAASETEVFNATGPDDALEIDLINDDASSLLNITTLPAGAYDKMDIEVYYLDMTIPTIYPGSESHDIDYRMVFEEDGVLQPRDFLLYLKPEWMTGNATLEASVTAEGWYWMDRGDPEHVVAVEGATEHPNFPVLDLFANDEFWSSEHKVLEGGVINPALDYDPEVGGVLTISFDVTEKFNFKDYHDDSTEADGLWEIRRDGGIHPFPPDFTCVPQETATGAN